MLRPGWFQEYSPKEQKLFDLLHKTIEQNFASYGYQHIHTPAVESVDVLKKWWDEVSKQIFGLYGLAQWSQDAKDYALHFDLTVPFARYVLDWQNELAFPFKRYQIQPVWRGERSQKGRYKEFRQADIDVIWKTKDDKWYNAVYDADCVVTLAMTLRDMLDKVGLEDKKITIHYNNKKFVKWFAEWLVANHKAKSTISILWLFDKYHKLSKEKFGDWLKEIGLSNQWIEKVFKFLKAEKAEDVIDIDMLDNNDYKLWWVEIMSLGEKLKVLQENNKIEFLMDPSIVRGLDYYTGTVFETFIDDKKELGSVCSWGAYANLTEFLDPKQSFSGIGGSIGLSRLMSVLLEDYKIMETFVPEESSYLVIHEEKTASKAQDIVAKLRASHKIAELYPLPDKLDKQFKYAEKKWISHIVQVFPEGVKYKKIGWEREVLNLS